MTEYIVTKLAVVVKGYLFSFDKKFNIFSLSSGNYNYSIIGGEVQGANIVSRIEYCVLRKERERKERKKDREKISIEYSVYGIAGSV